MWIFTTRGFYSVVQHDEDPGMLVVRARAREDLEALREFIPGLKVVVLPRRDYQFRAYVERVEWEAALIELVERLDYSNFKDSVTARQGKARHDIYLRVWSTLLALGHGEARRRKASQGGARRGEADSGQRQFLLPGDDLPFDPWADPDYPSASPARKQRGKGARKTARKARA